MSKVFVSATKFHVDEWDDERIDRCKELLPDSWTAHINSFKLLRDRVATLLGRWLLFRALQEHGFSGEQDIVIGEKDKPLFRDGPFFNISHSGEWVVVAVSAHEQVGIDVEMHRKVAGGIADKYFKPHELAKMVGNETAFFDYWAAKEAVIKADGRGVEILGKTWEIEYGSFHSDGNTWHVQPIQLEEGYSCRLATRHKADQLLDVVQPSAQPGN